MPKTIHQDKPGNKYNRIHMQACEICGAEFETYNGRFCDSCRPTASSNANKARWVEKQTMESRVKPIHPRKMGKRCPKCSGALLRGGVRFGYAANDVTTCINCGLSSESETYLDAKNGVRVAI